MKIGVISDTHGFFDPKISGLFKGVEHILHAGDIGPASILLQLEKIAPVTAVLGNNDIGLPLNETEVLTLSGRKFLLHHILIPRAPHDRIRGRLEQEQADVVIFGHSHKPHSETIGSTLFFNPGYAGKPRFTLERTLALLEIKGDQIVTQFKTL